MSVEERIKQVFEGYRKDGVNEHLANVIEEDVLQILVDYVVLSRKQLEQKYDEALAEPSDEMDKLDNLTKLFKEILTEEKLKEIIKDA